uniref:la-related protein 7 isoform X2 n=1 Tax=Myxine glutinosa TaxID=7769 RepID=UPI0035901B28
MESESDRGGAPEASDTGDLIMTTRKKRSRLKQLQSLIRKQVEFWMSDANLHKDRYLRGLMGEENDIAISSLTTFKKMKELTTDIALVARALKSSATLEVSPDGKRIRRKVPLGQKPVDVDERTVYVELLPRGVNHDWLEQVFGAVGPVVYVSVPRFASTGDPKGFAFVEFSSSHDAQRAVLNNPPDDAQNPGMFPKTRKKKPIFGEYHHKDPSKSKFGGRFEGGKIGKRDRAKKKRKSKPKTTDCKSKDTLKDCSVEVVPRKRKREEIEETDGGQFDEEKSVEEKDDVEAVQKRRRKNDETESWDEVEQKEQTNEERARGIDRCQKYHKESNGKDKEEIVAECIMEVKESAQQVALGGKEPSRRKRRKAKWTEASHFSLRVIPKKEWLSLRQDYLQLQKASLGPLKKQLRAHVEMTGEERKEHAKSDQHSQEVTGGAGKSEKPLTMGPEFQSAVLIQLASTSPLPGRAELKALFGSGVAYVDVREGETDGVVRFQTPDDAQKAITNEEENHSMRERNMTLSLIDGLPEQRYWQKILVERQAKLNRPREKNRGKRKILSRVEKLIAAKGDKLNHHLRFDTE